MRESLVSGSFSEFLLTSRAGLIARNSGATEFNQTTAHLAHGVLALIPRPIKSRQRDGQDPRGKELEQQMRNTQKQWPAAHALARAAQIVPQPQFFDFVEVDFDLETASVCVDSLYGIKRQIGTQQIPGGKSEPGDGH